MDLEQALAEIERLKGELAKFEGLDPTEITRDRQSLSDQLANTQCQYNDYKKQVEAEKAELQAQLTRRDIRFEFDKQFAGKVLPEYADVLYTMAAAGDNLQLQDGTVQTKDGKPLSDLLADFQSRYPAMFAAVGDGAGSGATGSNTVPNGLAKRTVTPVNGIISGVDPDAVISGDVKIKG